MSGGIWNRIAIFGAEGLNFYIVGKGKGEVEVSNRKLQASWSDFTNYFQGTGAGGRDLSEGCVGSTNGR